MDIIKELKESIPLLDGDNKAIVQDLLVVKLKELANEEVKKVELTQEEKDEQAILNYNGEDHG